MTIKLRHQIFFFKSYKYTFANLKKIILHQCQTKKKFYFIILYFYGLT